MEIKALDGAIQPRGAPALAAPLQALERCFADRMIIGARRLIGHRTGAFGRLSGMRPPGFSPAQKFVALLRGPGQVRDRTQEGRQSQFVALVVVARAGEQKRAGGIGNLQMKQALPLIVLQGCVAIQKGAGSFGRGYARVQ